MRTVARVGNIVLVGLLALVGYTVIHGIHNAKAHSAPGDDHRQLVLGPTGLGKLRLGMSERDAAATGEALDVDPKSRGTAPCSSQEINGVTIHFSRDQKIVGLAGPLERTRTADGIGAGATVADITAVYPALAHPELGTAQEQVNLLGEFSTAVPGNPDAVYRFIFATFEFQISGSTARPKTTASDRTHVKHILLSLSDQDECVTIS
jgi:hypothetical protein